jgi:hypothetical protein
MTTGTLHPLAQDYLERLRRAAAPLPSEARRDLLAEIEAHLLEALPEDATDADALNVLDRLGEPAEIVGPELPAPAPDRRGTREWAAIVLLALGGFVLGVGWIAGLILLWSSRAWSTFDKWLGTLILPGGLATGFAVLLSAGTESDGAVKCLPEAAGHVSDCAPVGSGSSVLTIAAVIVLVLAPLATSVYLALRAR